MIWDYIRDFLVQYIFGGYDSNGVGYGALLGRLDNTEYGEYYINTTDYLVLNNQFVSDGGEVTGGFSMSLGDWLSTTATIIIMCLAVFLMIMLVRWVWRLVTSAFLLK